MKTHFIKLAALLILFVPASADVVINEFMASNGTVISDEDGDYEDWIELHNPTTAAIDLGGWGLSDDTGSPFKWIFAPQTVIEPGGHLLVWASGKDRNGTDDPPPPPVATTPDALPGLVAWFRADSLTTADGEFVETWTDASGSGNHATQPNATQRPLMQANAINGLPALAFGGERQFSLPRSDFNGMENFENLTFLAVARWDGGVTSGLWGTGPSNATSGNLHFEITSGGGLRLRVAGMHRILESSVVTTGWSMLAASQDSSFEDPLAKVFVNGHLVGSRSEEVGSSALAEYGGFFLGNSHNSGRNFDGLIAEVTIFNRALDATELAALHTHFEEKYQLAPTPPPGLPNVPIHTNFRISADGEPLVLTRPDGTTADMVPAVVVPRDTSYGRQPNGTGDFHHFLEATPGDANTTQSYNAPVPPPEFSVARGFHQDAFGLTLSHPDPQVEIHFTTDGGVPTPGNSPAFTTPIPIASTTVIRAYAHKPGALPTSRIETHSYLFLDDVLQQRDDPDALGFPHAWGTWSATHYGFEPEVGESPEYAPLMKQALSDIPTMSLVMEMDDLFHPDTGIYASRSRPGGAPRGVAWERPVSVEILHPDGSREDLHINAGIRTQGGASRRADRTPKSSFRLLFKNIYETGTLEYPLFGQADGIATEFNSIILRAEYNNEWLHGFDENQRRRGQYARDQFMRNTQLAAGGHASRGNHVHLYLNGVYWGLYNPSERADAAFGSTYFGGEREDWDAVTHRGIRDGNGVAWSTLNSLANADLSIPANYQAVLEYIDLPQYIDYMIVNLWAGMNDWPFNNWNAIRRREPGNGFMFFCWDSERSMENINENRTNVNADAARFYNSMRANPEFRLAFADRVHRHFFNGGVLTPAQNIARYQAAAALVENAVIAESARWGSFRRDKGTVSGSESELFTKNIHWQAEYDRLINNYLPQRTGIVLQQFRNANLYPPIEAPTFHQHGGELAAGELLSITAPQGQIFYTTENLDPRDPDALPYTSPIAITENTVVHARAFHNGTWSALLTAEFTSGDALPERIDLIENGEPLTRNPTFWFDPPLSGSETLTASVSSPSVASAAIDGGQLVVTGLLRGETQLVISAADGENDALETTVRLLVHPAPHPLGGGPYLFDQWDPATPAATYPPHMLFLQGAEDDSSLTTKLDRAYQIPENDAAASEDVDFPYAASSRTRINGLGEDGISFINTGRSRDLGGALLALDTTGLDEARISFTAGTVLPNSRIYAIRLQHRLGVDGPFTDLMLDGQPVEYIRNANAGHEQIFEPIDLPAALLDQPYVQILWRYHLVSGTSGPRARLRLDDVFATDGSSIAPEQIVFDVAPQGTQSGGTMPPITIRLLDSAGFPATTFNGPVTLSLIGDGSLTGTLTVDAVNGTATFDDLVLTGTGSHQLVANAAGLDPATSSAFRSLGLTTLILPQFIQGEQDAQNANNDRVPFAWHARIDGLAPHATYRFGNRVVIPGDNPTNDGAGNMIFATSPTENWIRTTDSPRFRPDDLGTRHFTFTADPDGSFTGWFLTEPSGNPRFTPGNSLHFRLLLNDGNDGEETTHILTTAESAQVLRFGSTPSDGTAIIGESSTAARRIALLYEETAGTTRPLAATPVEITGAEVDSRYAAFYQSIVATNQSHWGTIIPNQLAGGLRRIEIRSADATADLLDTRTDANGFPGTINPSGGLAAAILLDADSGLPVFLPGGNGTWHSTANWSNGTIPNAPAASAILNAPVGGNRNVNTNATTTIGTLRVNQADTDFRNRIRTNDGTGTLTFDSGTPGTPATLRIEGAGGSGHVDFDFDNPTTLASDLVLLINHADGSDPQQGALRLQQTWTGPGGLIKQGPGLSSLTGGEKSFTGPLVIEQGALRITGPAVPAFTSGVAVLPGGQLRLVSEGSIEEPRVHTFGGGAIALGGIGRGGDLPVGQELGILGALRYDPGTQDNLATLTNPLNLTAETDIHIDGTRNTLRLDGPITGNGHSLIKTGGGTLALTTPSPVPAPPIDVQTGTLAIHTHHPAAITLAGETTLTGSGTVATLSGPGTVSPGNEILTASQSSAARIAAILTTPGPNNNGTLALTDDSNPLPTAPQTIDLFLDPTAPLLPGDRFQGGLTIPTGIDLANLLAATDVRVFLADPAGEIDHLGTSYRSALPSDDLTWSASGTTLEVLQNGNPTAYEQWRNLRFEDPADRADDAISGPHATDATGTANLLRYAFNLDLDTPIAPFLPRLNPANNTFQFALDPAKADLAWIVHSSEDLLDWSTGLFDSRSDPPPSPGPNGLTPIPFLPDRDALFLRLELLLID